MAAPNDVHAKAADRLNRRLVVPLLTVFIWVAGNVVLYTWLSETDRSEDNRPAEPDPAVVTAYRECSLRDGNGPDVVELRYQLLEPADRKSGRLYPLLVYLHGAGHRGSDNRRQLLDLPSQMVEPTYRRCCAGFVLAPQCPEGVDWTSYVVRRGPGSEGTPAVFALIDAVMAEQPIDRNRVYLTGFSMGGFGTWGLAAECPDLFAAVVPVCGGGDPARASRLVDVPVWAVHGSLDTVILPEQSQAMVNAMITAGGKPRYTAVPDEGHTTAWAYSLDNGVLEWLFAQRRK